MWFKRMELESWFDRCRYAMVYDTGENADAEEIDIGFANLDKALSDFV